MEVSNIEF